MLLVMSAEHLGSSIDQTYVDGQAVYSMTTIRGEFQYIVYAVSSSPYACRRTFRSCKLLHKQYFKTKILCALKLLFHPLRQQLLFESSWKILTYIFSERNIGGRFFTVPAGGWY